MILMIEQVTSKVWVKGIPILGIFNHSTSPYLPIMETNKGMHK